MPSDHFVDFNIAPEGLRESIAGGNVEYSLAKYCETLSPGQLEQARQAIHAHHPGLRAVVQREIDKRIVQGNAAEARFNRWIAVGALAVSILSFIVAIVALRH